MSTRTTPRSLHGRWGAISVEVAYRCAQQVRDFFDQAAPTQGRLLAARLVESLAACLTRDIARLGRTPAQVEGRVLGLLRHGRSQQWPHRSHQWHYRHGQTYCQSLPKPHQLPTL